uniref:BZIP domain-containing protein n=2 Tax=Leersia perrieri TaxID=77586 RepID=A0A0D9XXN7_9ORYZ
MQFFSAEGEHAMMANARFQKQALLPPRSPFPAAASPSPSPHGELGPIARPRDGGPHRHGHHQRTSSESVLIDEQPSWLDDLLDEPEAAAAPAARPHGRPGHRRSSSDSFTLFDGGNSAAAAAMYDNVFDGMRGGGGGGGGHGQQVGGSWGGAPEFFPEPSSFGRPQGGHGRPWDNRQMLRHGGGAGMPMPMPMREMNGGHRGPPGAFGDLEHGSLPNGVDRKVIGDIHDQRVGAERKEGAHLRHSQSEADTKRAKQQYAQRSRVRKLQYIAELERRVQSLQTEGVEVSAEMDFLGQQNIMLDLENKALKQRLESLSQEHLIKRFQQEMFEREIGRLRSLFQQQQQQQHMPQQQGPTHSRSNSRDLDSQFANMSLKHSDPNSGCDAVPGLRI